MEAKRRAEIPIDGHADNLCLNIPLPPPQILRPCLESGCFHKDFICKDSIISILVIEKRENVMCMYVRYIGTTFPRLIDYEGRDPIFSISKNHAKDGNRGVRNRV